VKVDLSKGTIHLADMFTFKEDNEFLGSRVIATAGMHMMARWWNRKLKYHVVLYSHFGTTFGDNGMIRNSGFPPSNGSFPLLQSSSCHQSVISASHYENG
jgi:hypothetical protein